MSDLLFVIVPSGAFTTEQNERTGASYLKCSGVNSGRTHYVAVGKGFRFEQPAALYPDHVAFMAEARKLAFGDTPCQAT